MAEKLWRLPMCLLMLLVFGLSWIAFARVFRLLGLAFELAAVSGFSVTLALSIAVWWWCGRILERSAHLSE